MLRRIVLTAAGALVLAIVATAPAAPTRSGAACGTITGPLWTIVDPFTDPVNHEGTIWKVEARGVGCSFAKLWARKLVKTPFKGEAVTRFRVVPKGWRCVVGGGLTGGGVGTPGQCNKGSKMFFWAPRYP